MDTAYAELDIPFDLALAVVATVIHTNPKWSVADCGLKALGMDHGNPTIGDADVVFVTPVYPAGEEPIDGVDSAALVEGLRAHGAEDLRREVVARPREVGDPCAHAPAREAFRWSMTATGVP